MFNFMKSAYQNQTTIPYVDKCKTVSNNENNRGNSYLTTNNNNTTTTAEEVSSSKSKIEKQHNKAQSNMNSMNQAAELDWYKQYYQWAQWELDRVYKELTEKNSLFEHSENEKTLLNEKLGKAQQQLNEMTNSSSNQNIFEELNNAKAQLTNYSAKVQELEVEKATLTEKLVALEQEISEQTAKAEESEKARINIHKQAQQLYDAKRIQLSDLARELGKLKNQISDYQEEDLASKECISKEQILLKEKFLRKARKLQVHEEINKTKSQDKNGVIHDYTEKKLPKNALILSTSPNENNTQDATLNHEIANGDKHDAQYLAEARKDPDCVRLNEQLKEPPTMFSVDQSKQSAEAHPTTLISQPKVKSQVRDTMPPIGPLPPPLPTNHSIRGRRHSQIGQRTKSASNGAGLLVSLKEEHQRVRQARNRNLAKMQEKSPNYRTAENADVSDATSSDTNFITTSPTTSTQEKTPRTQEPPSGSAETLNSNTAARHQSSVTHAVQTANDNQASTPSPKIQPPPVIYNNVWIAPTKISSDEKQGRLYSRKTTRVNTIPLTQDLFTAMKMEEEKIRKRRQMNLQKAKEAKPRPQEEASGEQTCFV